MLRILNIALLCFSHSGCDWTKKHDEDIGLPAKKKKARKRKKEAKKTAH